MASKEREVLLLEAQGVGLAVGVDFQENISNANLKKKIDSKKAELENQLKGNDSEQSEDKNQDDGAGVETGNDSEQSEEQTENYEDEMQIKRFSKCGNYKAVITGLKEVARRSGTTVEEVKESLETGKPVSTGFTFKEV